MLLFREMKTGKNSKWKPIQSGVVLTTKSIIDVFNHLTNDKGYKYLLTSRFYQDVLENTFSQIRAVQNAPNTIQCLQVLENLTIFQFLDLSTKMVAT